jgi:sec-independent protein translocase protein TatC
MRMLLGLAVIFQMPAMVFFLARMGVITARWMIRQFKYAVLFIVVIAAIITPSSDIASQMIVAGPMVVLYLLSIVIAWMFGKKRVLEAEA